MSSEKITRTVTITMDATVKDYNTIVEIANKHFPDRWEVESALSQNPVPGEQWKDGEGVIHTLRANGGHETKTFVLADADNDSECTTWTEQGIFNLSCFSSYNLVERVSAQRTSPLVIHVGEYWIDRKGNVHKIAEICDTTDSYIKDLFPIKSTLEFTWMLDGRYTTDGPHDMDLVKRICELP